MSERGSEEGGERGEGRGRRERERALAGWSFELCMNEERSVRPQIRARSVVRSSGRLLATQSGAECSCNCDFQFETHSMDC